MRSAVWTLLILASAVFSGAASAEKPGEDVGLRLLSHLPGDPLFVWVARIENPASSLDELLGFAARFGQVDAEAISAGIAQIDDRLGFSLRDELLASIGPEFAVVLDAPPIDEAAAAFSAPQQVINVLLGRVGLLARVRDVPGVERSVRRVFELAGASIEETGDLVRMRLPLTEEGEGQGGPPTHVDVHYGFRQKVFALSVSPEWVEASLEPQAGARIMAGKDFRRVFSQLDPSPLSLTYLNLPKLGSMVRSSAILQSLIAANEEARQIADVFLSPEFLAVGLGSTSVEVDGGVRTTAFGPPALGAGSLTPGILGAIAIPNLLHAIDRGKQKRTVADIRIVGTVSESFRIDNERYPGPTNGWVDLEAVADQVEPVYIRSLPRVDGWGNPLLYWSDGERYIIVSRGKDGAEDRDWSSADLSAPVTISDFNGDIVFSTGTLIVFPESEGP